MVVVTVARPEERIGARAIGRARVGEFLDEAAKPGLRLVDQRAEIAIAERLDLAGRIAAGEPPVFEARDRAAVDAVEAALFGDQRLQRKLGDRPSPTSSFFGTRPVL